MKKATRQLLVGVFAIVLIGVGIFAVVQFWPKPASTITPVTGEFDLIIKDGSRGVTLDNGDVTAALYGLPIGEDATDWAAWEAISGISDAADISENDLDTDEYSRFVMVYSATGIDIGDEDEDQNLAFYQRQVELYTGRVNTVYLYETPNNGAGFVIYNTNTLAAITFGTIAENVNFTVVTMINASQIHAKYVSYWNFMTNEEADLEWTFTANATCVAGDLVSKNGLVKTKPAATTIAFNGNVLDKNPLLYKFEWGSSPSNIVFNALALSFNKVVI